MSLWSTLYVTGSGETAGNKRDSSCLEGVGRREAFISSAGLCCGPGVQIGTLHCQAPEVFPKEMFWVGPVMPK